MTINNNLSDRGRHQHRRHRQQTMPLTRFLFILVWASLYMLSCSPSSVVHASDADIDCPGPDEAFVTSCSGSKSPDPKDKTSPETERFDDSDSKENVASPRKRKKRKAKNYETSEEYVNDGQHDTDTEGSTTIQQLKQTTKTLIERYYDPLPSKGKCAIGTICGFTASRLSLGVANRVFRLAGATWVLSEMLHTTGYCDEARCLPEEARPWVGVLRRALTKQSAKVRMIARGIWDEDRIREIAQQDEMVAGGFAAGAFIGFVV